MLLVASVVVFIASGSGTPAFTMAPRMRQKRSRIEYSTMPLMIGSLSTNLSLKTRPFSDLNIQIIHAMNSTDRW